MTPNSTTDTIGVFSSTNLGIAKTILASILLFQLTTTIDAYSIVLPAATRKRHDIGISSTNKIRRHWQSPTKSIPTSLRASRSFDYVRNATAPSTTLDEEEMRLLRFMEDALLELESFQTPREEDSIVERDHFAFPLEDSIHSQELSLLFPETPHALNTTSTTSTSTTSVVATTSDAAAVSTPQDAMEETPQDGIWRARWLLVAAAALYGTNFSVVKLLGDEMPVGISTPLRFGLAVLATLPWLLDGFVPNLFQAGNDNNQLSSAEQKEESDRRIMATLYGLEVGLWNSIGYVAQAVGLETTLASESAFLCSMAVVIVPLLDWIAGKKLLSRQWVGALMALVGVAFLELGDVNALQGHTVTTGALLSLVQPFTFGLGFWRMEQAMHRFPQEAQRMTAAQLFAIFVSSVAYGLWTMGVFEPVFASADIGTAVTGIQSALASVPATFPWKEWSHDPAILFSLFWTGCITTALTIYMETLALESLSAAETTLIFSTEPLWGTAFAVALMGEQMGMNSVVGAGFILTACVYSNLGVSGLQDLWASGMKTISGGTPPSQQRRRRQAQKSTKPTLSQSLRNHWPGLLMGFGASTAVASEIETQEFDDLVEEVIENLADKL